MKVSAGLIVTEHRDPVSHYFIAENQGERRHCWNVIRKEKDHFLFPHAGEDGNVTATEDGRLSDTGTASYSPETLHTREILAYRSRTVDKNVHAGGLIPVKSHRPCRLHSVGSHVSMPGYIPLQSLMVRNGMRLCQVAGWTVSRKTSCRRYMSWNTVCPSTQNSKT